MFTANRDLALFTPDLDAAYQFYAEVMELPCVSRSDSMLHFESGPLCLFVLKAGEAQGFTPSFDVSDAATARERLLAAGCTALSDSESGGHFRDPFGFVFDVLERS